MAVVSTVGGIVGVAVYTPVLLVCDLCVLLALHRSGAVADQSRSLQAGAYGITFVISTVLLLWVGALLQSRARIYVQQVANAVVESMNKASSPVPTQSSRDQTRPEPEKSPGQRKSAPQPPVGPHVHTAGAAPSGPAPVLPATVAQQRVIDPEVQLLERAVDAVRSCRSFVDSSFKRLNDAQAMIQEHNSFPGVTELSKSTFTQWKMGGIHEDDMQLYSQVYKQDFMEVRRLLVLKGVGEAEPGIDYESPGNMVGVVGICHDLSDITEAYIKHEYVERKINLHDARRYLGLLRPAPLSVNH